MAPGAGTPPEEDSRRECLHDRRSEGVKVKILLDDGSQVDLSGVDQKQLEIALDRRTTSRH